VERPQAWRLQTADLAQDTHRDRRGNAGSAGRGRHRQQCGRRAMLPGLLDQIPADQELGSVTADGAYDTRKCHDAIADLGANAIIPPRRNARFWTPKTTGAVARNEAPRASRYLGRAIWRRCSGDHRRSRVETRMHCVKLLGQRLLARELDRRGADLQVRIAVLNRYTALGIPVTKAAG